VLREQEAAAAEAEGDPTLQTQLKELQSKYDVLLKGEQRDVDEYVMQLQDCVFDYFNIIVKEYYMAQDRWGSDTAYVAEIKKVYEKIDKEIEADDLSEEIPEALNRQLSENLLKNKEQMLTQVYSQLSQMMNKGGQDNFDFEQTILLNRTMFDDKMYMQTGFSGKDLQRAITKHGILAERMQEAKKLESKQQERLEEAYKKFFDEKEAAKKEGQQKQAINV